MNSVQENTSSSSMGSHIFQVSGSPMELGMGLAHDIASSTVFLLTIGGVVLLSSSVSFVTRLMRTGKRKTCTCRSCELGSLTIGSGRLASAKLLSGVTLIPRFRRRSTSSSRWI